jgi:hypothetical protein
MAAGAALEGKGDRDHLSLRCQEDQHLAEDLGMAALSDVTADTLDGWRGMWSPTAEKKYNRIGLSSQSAFLGYSCHSGGSRDAVRSTQHYFVNNGSMTTSTVALKASQVHD